MSNKITSMLIAREADHSEVLAMDNGYCPQCRNSESLVPVKVYSSRGNISAYRCRRCRTIIIPKADPLGLVIDETFGGEL